MRERIGEHSAETADHQKILNMEHDRMMARKVKTRVSYVTLREVARNCEVPHSFVNDHMFQVFGFPMVMRCWERTVNRYDLLLWLRTYQGQEFVEMARAEYGAINLDWVDGYVDNDGRSTAAGNIANGSTGTDGRAGVPNGQGQAAAVRGGMEAGGLAENRGWKEVAVKKKRVAHIERPCSQSEQIRRRREAEKVEPMDYLKVHLFLDYLKKSRKRMSHQEYMTIRGQALSGDLKGAEKGLKKVLGR